MPRTRRISHQFFKDDDLAELSLRARLTFAGLWTLADREGRLVDRPKLIKGELFPYENCDMEGVLEELARDRVGSEGGFILRYGHGNKRYIQILNFERYQKPHPKEPESEIPYVECLGDVEVSPKVIPSHDQGARAGHTKVCVPDQVQVQDQDLEQEINPEEVASEIVAEVNRWLPEQQLKLHQSLVTPIANLLLCGHPAGVTKIRGDPPSDTDRVAPNGSRFRSVSPYTRADLLDLVHGYIVQEATNRWHIDERERGHPFVFARLLRDADRIAEYMQTGRQVWDKWRGEQDVVDEEAEAIAKCPRDHEREKKRMGKHWACPDICGWTAVIRVAVEE